MGDLPTSMGAAEEVAAAHPLWKAALAWCEPSLVQELLEANVAYYAARKAPPSENPFPTGRDKTLARTAALVGDRLLALSQRRDAAVANIDVDLRQHIASRQVILLGLKVKPEIEGPRTVLSEYWADYLAFDWEHSTVSVYGALYVGVTGHAARSQRDRSKQTAALAQLIEVDRSLPKPVGRASHKPIIEATFATYLREKGKTSQEFVTEQPNISQVAMILEARLKKLHPNRAAVDGGLPKRETIRKHLRDMLKSALVVKGGR